MIYTIYKYIKIYLNACAHAYTYMSARVMLKREVNKV